MWLLAVFAILPFIYLFSWIAAPFLYVGIRTVHFTEKIAAAYGGFAAFLFCTVLIWLVVFCGKSKWFLVPLAVVLLFATAFGGWR